jgi:hypothetical protein
LVAALCVALVALACAGSAARNLDGMLGLILRPVSTIPVIVKAGEGFDVTIRADQPVEELRIALYRGRESTEVFAHSREQPPLQPKDGAVTVRAKAPAGAAADLYGLRVRATPGRRGDTAERAVKVVAEWPRTYTFAHVTDVHIGRADPPLRDQVFRRTAAEINRLGVDFVLLTGDLTDGATPEQYRTFLELLDLFEAPTFCTPGNHDRGDNARPEGPDSIYERYCGAANYAFEFGRHRYLSLDTRWSDEYLTSPAHRAWLEEQLRRPDPALGIAFSHRISEDEYSFYQDKLPAHNYRAYIYGHTHDDGIRWVGPRRLMLVNTSQELMSTYAVLTVTGDEVVALDHYHRAASD